MSADPAPDRASAGLRARLSKQPIEVLAERNETSSTFALPDGSWRMDTFGGPVRLRRGDEWVDVDTTLQAGADGVRPKAVPSGLRLNGGGPAATVLASLGDGAAELSWSSSLPSPSLEGDTARYAEVVPGGDVVVRATRTGFEQAVVLRQRPSKPLSFVLPLRLREGSLTMTAAGDLVVRASDGTVRATAPAPRMWGASVDSASGEPIRSAAVAMSLRDLGGGRYEVRLSPDPAFLADPSVTLPITVDPGRSSTAPTPDRTFRSCRLSTTPIRRRRRGDRSARATTTRSAA